MNEFKRILAAVDFSDASKMAAARAAEMAERYHAQLLFLHVLEHFPEHLPHYHMEGEDMDPEEFLLDRAGKDLAELCSQLGHGDALRDVVLTTHSAKSEILKYIKQQDIDLVVLGLGGKRPLIADLIGGSTATGIVRTAPCDVLTVCGND